MNWYKVIVLAIDVFESAIVDEKHFGSKIEADQFISGLSVGQISVIVPMGEESKCHV